MIVIAVVTMLGFAVCALAILFYMKARGDKVQGSQKRDENNGEQETRRLDYNGITGGSSEVESRIAKANGIPGDREEEGVTALLRDYEDATTLISPMNISAVLVRMSTHERIPVRVGKSIVGREAGAVDICIEGNLAISRIHAYIDVRDNGVYVEAGDTVNGTYLNGRRLRPGEEAVLQNGDAIAFADDLLRFEDA